MPISHVSKLYAVEDAKIYELTSDPDGGAPAYGAAIDMPGIKVVGIGGSVNNSTLRGDNSLLDSFSVLENVEVSMEWAKINLDAQAIMLGGTVTDSGTTPDQLATFARARTDKLKYFKLEAKTPVDGVDMVGGAAALKFYKCILSGFPEGGLAEEDFQTQSVTLMSVPLISNDAWWDVILQETSAALSA